jgi:hypothetical protein
MLIRRWVGIWIRMLIGIRLEGRIGKGIGMWNRIGVMMWIRM